MPTANVLPLTRVINVSVSQTPLGLNNFNPNNVAIFTPEIPANSFGSAGFKLYEGSADVQTDFGSTSRTYLDAVAGFAQNPNILSGDGQLVVIPMLITKQTLTLSGVPATGSMTIESANGTTAAIDAPFTAASIQAALNLITGQSGWQVSGSGESYVISCGGSYGSVALFTVTPTSLETSGSTPVTVTPTVTQVGETLGAAIIRTQGLCQYCGILETFTYAVLGQTDALAAAAIVQALPLILYIATFTEADIQTSGIGSLLVSGGYTHTRLLYYGDNSSGGVNALTFAAAYAFRGHCVDFTGSNTTLDMDLKQLATIQPDPSMTNTIGGINGEAATNGADIYAALASPAQAGQPPQGFVLVSGANWFWDEVYNAIWLQMALQIAGFNYLAQTNTKVPQTEPGVTGYKASLGIVMQQAITNGYGASGLNWSGETPFGDPQTFVNNILAVGWYMYSQPVNQQTQANRVARQMPLVQIALKEAGSGETSNIIVNLNP